MKDNIGYYNWLALYPYSIFLGVISVYMSVVIIKSDFVIANNIMIILIILFGILSAVFFIFYVPKRCCYITKNVNFDVMHKSQNRLFIVKLIHLPAYIVIILTIIGCVNPFLIVLGIYLLMILLKCVHMTSKILLGIVNNRAKYKMDKVVKSLLYIPFIDIVCAYFIIKKDSY